MGERKGVVSRRAFLTGSAMGMAATAAPAPKAKTPKKPNFIFFMPETLRAESIGCYGHPLVRTPNMDRLASQGVRFAQCHSQNTVCGPSRVSLMTGWPVHVHGHRSLYYFLHKDEPNLFRYLKRNGYDTYMYGKNDLLAPECFAGSFTWWGSPRGRTKPAGNPWPFDDPHYYSFLYQQDGDRRNTADYAKIEAAIRILKRDSDKPFCIYLPMSYVHPPYTAPAGFYDMYDPAKVPPLRPIGLAHRPLYFEAIRRTRRLTQLSEADFRKIQAVYLGMISYSDWMLGELLAALEQTGHDGDTAVFLFSDHGDYGGDYGLVEKWPNAVEDVLHHLPLIMRVPGMSRGHVVEEVVENFDVMATCLELAGIQAEHTNFARSLVPQLRGARGDEKRAAYCEGGYNVNEPQDFEPWSVASNPRWIYYPKIKLQNDHPDTITRTTMIRTSNYKLVRRPDGQDEFYDLWKDPRELHNVIGDRQYATRREELNQRMLEWYIRTADVAPKKHDPRGSPKFPG